MKVELPSREILAADAAGAPPAGVEIGRSRGGRPMVGYRFGGGPLRVSLIAGCHADEPVGPAMLDRLAAYLHSLSPHDPALTAATWWLVPHANPDGESDNEGWTEHFVACRDHRGGEDRGYDLAAYHGAVVRELPGDDVEFGFPTGPDDPGARPENQAVAAHLAGGAPYDLHVSFHGIGFTHGPWFLVEPFWVDRSRPLRRRLAELVATLGYRLHDVDRGGEKGFWRIERGFTTRPDSRSMRDYFLARDDRETAARFRPSSMEHVRGLGGDPLTMVPEMPLFLLPESGALAEPSLPRPDRLELIAAAVDRLGSDAAPALGLRPMPIRDQMRLQLAMVEAGLECVTSVASLANPT